MLSEEGCHRNLTNYCFLAGTDAPAGQKGNMRAFGTDQNVEYPLTREHTWGKNRKLNLNKSEVNKYLNYL